MLRKVGVSVVAAIVVMLAAAAPAQASTARYYSGDEVGQIVENFTEAASAAKLHCFVADAVKKMKKAKSKGGPAA